MSNSRVPLVDLAAQYETIKEEVNEAIQRVLGRTSFILGEEVEAFEQEFARYCGAAYAVGCANGTDAVELALRAVGVRRGDEVITVAHTFIGTTEGINAIGATPVFVDVEPDTLLMDITKVEEALTPRTRAIIAVHLYGQPVDMDPLMELAKSRGIKVIEDAAQAHGSIYKDRKVGTLGDVAAFSFYPGKNLGAYGDAGAVVTNDVDMADWVRKARNHGRASKYEHDFEGRNSRMDGLQGAILRVKLHHLDGWNTRRRELATIYDDLLVQESDVTPVRVRENRLSNFHLYVVQSDRRDDLITVLRDNGIEAGIHYPVPLHLQAAYRHLGVHAGRLPVTEAAASTIFSLPIYAEMDRSVCERVVTAIRASAVSTR